MIWMGCFYKLFFGHKLGGAPNLHHCTVQSVHCAVRWKRKAKSSTEFATLVISNYLESFSGMLGMVRCMVHDIRIVY
jgi:hypothetical protein